MAGEARGATMVNPEGAAGARHVDPPVNRDALKSEIRAALINQKVRSPPPSPPTFSPHE